MSTAPPAKTLLSQGQAKVGPSGLCAAAGAQAGGFPGAGGRFALPADLSRPPPALPRLLRSTAGGQRGQTVAPARCGGVSLMESSRGLWGRDADGRAAVPQLAAIPGLSFINHDGAGGTEGGESPQEGICLLIWGGS